MPPTKTCAPGFLLASPGIGKSFQKLWQQKLELVGRQILLFWDFWGFFLEKCGCISSGQRGFRGEKSMKNVISWGWHRGWCHPWGSPFLQGHPRGGMGNPKFLLELEKLQKHKVCIRNQPDFGILWESRALAGLFAVTSQPTVAPQVWGFL